MMRRMPVNDVDAAVDQLVREPDLVSDDVVAPVGSQWMEATATSPGSLACRTASAICSAAAVDDSGTRWTPGRSSVAAHPGGSRWTPSRTRRPAPAHALRRARPPAARPGSWSGRHRLPADPCRPARRASPQAHGCRNRARGCSPARTRPGGPRPGYRGWRAHPVVHGLARGEVAGSGDARLQVHDPDVRRGLVQRRQGTSPGPCDVDRARDPAVRSLRQLD